MTRASPPPSPAAASRQRASRNQDRAARPPALARGITFPSPGVRTRPGHTGGRPARSPPWPCPPWPLASRPNLSSLWAFRGRCCDLSSAAIRGTAIKGVALEVHLLVPSRHVTVMISLSDPLRVEMPGLAAACRFAALLGRLHMRPIRCRRSACRTCGTARPVNGAELST